MPKILRERLRCSGFSVFIAAAFASLPALTLLAQPTPLDDPKALLQEAAERNGLARKGMKPWHLKVSFISYAENGKEAEEGTIEEFWAAPNKHKIVRTSAKGSQTDFKTENGILRTGERGSMGRIYTEIYDEFASPISLRYVHSLPSSAGVQMQMRRVGQSSLRCLTVTFSIARDSEQRDLHGPATCLDEKVPALRVLGTLLADREYEFNDVESFQDNYVARTIQETRDHKKEFVARIDVLEELNDINTVEFTPPPDAVPVKNAVRISPIVAQGLQIKRVDPEYPIGAKAQRISGTVVVEMTIDKSGHVSDAHVVAGPPMLQQPAADAVRRWTYKPYILDGEAVEVITSAGVTFNLEGHN